MVGASGVSAALHRFVDPRLLAYAEECRALRVSRGVRRGPSDLPELLRARAARAVPAGSPSTAVVLDASADGHRVPVRVLTPRSVTTPRGVLLDLHGGGFYLDSAARDDVRNQDLADTLGVVVVSVEYRLAPEHPWPAAPDDAGTAARWLVAHAGSRFGTSRLAIGGTSAGATLATTTLLRLREPGLTDAVVGAVLQFGTYDLSGRTPAGRRIADEYFLDAYAGQAPDRTDPDLSPVFADLHDLPPTLLLVGTADVLLEDNLAMAARLAVAGNDVDLRLYPEAPHGFTSHPTAMAAAAREDVVTWLDARFDADPDAPGPT